MAGSLPKNRPHAHSISSNSLHPPNRVTRRKSMSSTAASNVAALAAAAKGTIGAPLEGAIGGVRRPSKPSSQFRGPSAGFNPAMASSMPGQDSAFGPGSYGASSEAVVDGPALATMPEHEKGNSKSRIRRASEGNRLTKTDGKRTSGSELKCEKCGKGYKHSSCLTKHLSVPLSLPLSSHILSRLMTNALPLAPLRRWLLCVQVQR